MTNLTTYEGIAAFSRRAIEETKRPNCDGTYSESKIDRNDVIKHHELIAEACEKQIAKKPLKITMEYDGDYGHCPSCDEILADYSDTRVCKSCGQKIDWGGSK